MEDEEGADLNSERREMSAKGNYNDGKRIAQMYDNNQYGGKVLCGVADTDLPKYQFKDKSDFSTKDKALDGKTKSYITKLIDKGSLESLVGCIATGKEANVYYCTSSCTSSSGVPDQSIICALKVHKTCIVTFKNRKDYNEKDVRSKRVPQGGLKSHIEKWCKAEAKNLRKMAGAGIPCPKVYCRYKHLLLMELVGIRGMAAPRLHNSSMNLDLACTLYGQIIRYMRTMYWKCNMVHADLSEFNILLLHDTPYIIDVSQAVPRGHPHSFKHLRQDCTNITEFFRKMGVSTLMIQELFFFIVDMTITDENVESYLEECMEKCSKRDPHEMTNEEIVAENAFKEVFLPMTLNEAEYFERDYEMIKAGLKSCDDVPSLTIFSLNSQMSGVRDEPQLLIDKREKEIDEEASETSDEETSESEDEESEKDSNSAQFKEPQRPVHPKQNKREKNIEKWRREREVKHQKSENRRAKKMSQNEKKSGKTK